MNSKEGTPRHRPFIDPRWIRIGFNLGLGLFVAGLICYSLLAVCVYGVLFVFWMLNVAVSPVMPYIIYTVLGILCLVLLVLVSGFAGKSLAGLVNRRRERIHALDAACAGSKSE